MNIFKMTQDKLRKSSLKNLKKILRHHDNFFLSQEEFPDERLTVRENNKDSIVNWIMATDPFYVEGGLLSFIREMKKENLLL